MRIEDFLLLESPEMYDFKNEGANKLYSSLENNIEKFLLYKSSGCIGSKYFPEMDSLIKEDKHKWKLMDIDCDTSSLAKEIYHRLWKEAIEDKDNSTISGEYGETMTSFQSLFNIFVEEKIETKQQADYRKIYFPTKNNNVTKRYILHLYYSCGDFIKKCSSYNAVELFARSVHQIGNFIPVPKWFNKNRAHHDSWDLTLSKIREFYLEPDEKEKDNILATLLCSKTNVINECKKWLQWCACGKKSNEGWKKFIEVNYMEAFVNQDNMKPIMFCENHNWNSKPSGVQVIQIFETCNKLIEKRGIQMIERLKLNEYFDFVELDYKNVEDTIKALNVENLQPREIIKMLTTLKREGQLNEKIYTYESWKTWKNEKGVDLDDTRGENPFIRAIYYLIWGKSFNVGEEIKRKGIYSKGWGNFTTSECLPRNLSKCVWGGDCANTIASYKKLLEGVTKKKSLDTLCGRNHQIGNFILVPAYFNKWRGCCLEDRFDKSLLTLKNDPEKSFDFYNEVQNNLRTSKKSTREEKIEIIKENFETLDCVEFNTYINWLFLWDYVFVKDGEYLVKDMTEEAINQNCVENEKNQILPKNMNELNANTYVRNVNYFVERRNLFIAAMLYIALECVPVKSESDWAVSTIYAVIMKKVFLNENQVFSGYEDVIKKMKDAVEKEENLQDVERIKAVLDMTLDKIASVKY